MSCEQTEIYNEAKLETIIDMCYDLLTNVCPCDCDQGTESGYSIQCEMEKNLVSLPKSYENLYKIFRDKLSDFVSYNEDHLDNIVLEVANTVLSQT